VAIPPGASKIEIDFTVCDLVAPQRASFQYMLEGFDQNWKQAVRTRSTSYTNLKPAHYTFHVRANDSYSSSGASEASLSFTLQPKLYQTGWFYCAEALAVVLLIWGSMVLYARQTRARYALLLKERLAERNRLAREMHDTLIQGCVGVATLLEAADRFRSVDAQAADNLLDDARNQIVSTLDEARQAIWDLRHAPVENAAITMLFDLARKLGGEKGIEIETEIAGKSALDPTTDRTILLVGREALRNAVLHANPHRIRIRIDLQPAEVILEVSDDGVGFSETEATNPANQHFGVIGMRERVERSGGSLRIDTAPGKGTKIVVHVPQATDPGQAGEPKTR
jgi:signal transduction histidine kinase